ncbi:MAG: hypothetical protein LAP87_03435 [Acidobacteriia bacterium]|nr:hypothetical protein [Terriglobia bacterium]
MSPSGRPRVPLAATLLLLAAAAVLAYAPSLGIPLIADDYSHIAMAQRYGSLSGLPALFHDAIFRLRATSYWTMYPLWGAFHLTPWAWHAASLAVHIANTWLVYFVAASWPRMRSAAPWAAALFAVHEGHQEAVMWFCAISELWMFFFGMAALWCWLQSAARKPAWPWQVGGVILFALALVSKESAVVFLPLFLLAAPSLDPRWLLRVVPYAALAAVAVASIAAARAYSFRFTDGSFSLHAPFWLAWPRSFARLLWIWGWVAALAILLSRDRRLLRAALNALAWIGIALIPYSFLTYSTQIPSRQIYLASAGLAFLFGLALAHVCSRWAARPRLAAAVIAVMLVHNIAYLWTRKRAQFLARAEPTEQLLALARRTSGPIWVRCFPWPGMVADDAVRLALGPGSSPLVWSAAEAAERPPAAVFCYRETR